MNELALFAGAGGGILGGMLLGWRTVCAVEIDPYAASVLAQRQNDGVLPPFPIWDDVRTFDGRPWRGIVDIISGGFPCQDISCAGKGAGIDGERSGLWREFARIIGEVRPRFVLVENSPMLTVRGLGTVLGDLAALGFDARWGVLGAVDAGAPHKRERLWILANADRSGFKRKRQAQPAGWIYTPKPSWPSADVADSNSQRRQKLDPAREPAEQGRACWKPHAGATGWWAVEPGMGRVADGVAARVDRLRAIGNGQVPAVVVRAWETLRSME